jgi:hypothetical protein
MSIQVKLLVVGLCAVAAVGCGKKAEEVAAEKTLEAMTGGKVDIQDGGSSVTVDTDNGKLTMSEGKSAKVPTSFPKDAYVPSDAKLSTSIVGENSAMIGYAVPGDSAKLYETIRTDMQGRGWKEEMAMQTPESSVLSYTKDNRTMQYMISVEAGSTSVTQSYAANQQPASELQ